MTVCKLMEIYNDYFAYLTVIGQLDMIVKQIPIIFAK